MFFSKGSLRSNIKFDKFDINAIIDLQVKKLSTKWGVMTEKTIYGPADVAKMLGVSPITIRKWARDGDLVSHSTAGGHRRFLYDDVRQFALRHDMKLFSESTEKRRILVVEDDAQFAEFVGEALQSLDPLADVVFAQDGFEAGRVLQRFEPDILLLDLMLPGIDGFSICRRLRRDPETRSIRIIAMTGYDSPENVTRILDAGAETCLSKPFSITELVAAVEGDGFVAVQKSHLGTGDSQ
jgi:excisionase family DNA binding protein